MPMSPAFFKKKIVMLEGDEKSERFLSAIQELGATWELPSCTFQQVQAYICALYGNTKYRSIN